MRSVKEPKDYSIADIDELEKRLSGIIGRDELNLTKTEVNLLHKYILLLCASGHSEKDIAARPPFARLPREGVISLIQEVLELYQRAAHSKKQSSSHAASATESEGAADGKAHPDLGLQLSKRGVSRLQTFHFLPFKVYNVSRIGARRYSTGCNTQHDNEEFSMTLDFGVEAYKKLLEFLPGDFSKRIAGIFKNRFEVQQMIELPSPVRLGVEARLGEKQSNDDEEFIPFEVVKFYAAD
jgi:hypothetical protein